MPRGLHDDNGDDDDDDDEDDYDDEEDDDDDAPVVSYTCQPAASEFSPESSGVSE
jgi:hypothetical protein